MANEDISVAFVCLGNICRSPMAEAVFKHQVEQSDIKNKFGKIDSFGTGGWHRGESPDRRSSRCCRSNGVPVVHKAQQLRATDFDKFDYILCMDEDNLNNVKKLQPRDNNSKVLLFGDFRRSSRYPQIVDDPYYGGENGFQVNFEQLTDFSKGFLEKVANGQLDDAESA